MTSIPNSDKAAFASSVCSKGTLYIGMRMLANAARKNGRTFAPTNFANIVDSNGLGHRMKTHVIGGRSETKDFAFLCRLVRFLTEHLLPFRLRETSRVFPALPHVRPRTSVAAQAGLHLLQIR